MSGRPPIWMVVAVQALSVIGDSFGQRVSRVNHKGSRRHMMLALSLMSAVQVLVILGIIQLVLSPNITGAMYEKGERLPCTQEECTIYGKTKNCTVIHVTCESQGPFSMFQQIWAHPLLLLNGLINIAYYTGETMLYREPLGLVFLVLASLASTFLINPMNLMIGQPIDQPIPWPVLALGMSGALLCVIEKKPKPPADMKAEDEENNSALYDEGTLDYPIDQTKPLLSLKRKRKPSIWRVLVSILFASVRVAAPFLLLSITYASWFVIQKFVDNDYKVNAFGYNALDQGLLPLYIFPWLFLVDFIKPLKIAYEDKENLDESFAQALKNTWQEASLVNLFMYRLFINGRAFAYFFLAVSYNLTLVYLELTLIRVVLSYIGSIVLCLLIPRFIGATPAERRSTFSFVNLILKFAGTCAITGSLILLNVVY